MINNEIIRIKKGWFYLKLTSTRLIITTPYELVLIFEHEEGVFSVSTFGRSSSKSRFNRGGDGRGIDG